MAKKYIDTYLLKKEINKHYDEYKAKFHQNGERYYLGLIDGLDMAERIIDSLQQEQPCDTCTNDKGCVTCKDGELWEGKEQPSDDLKGAIREWVNLMVGASFPEQDGDYISEEDYRSVIRQTALHFYELGQQAKKEEQK